MLAIELNSASLQALWDQFIAFLPSLVTAALILGLGFWLSSVIGKITVRWMSRRNVDATAHAFIRSVVVLLLKFIVVLSALATLGVNVNSFIAALAAAGATAGIGLKDSISQFASGMQILFNKPFKKGDYIAIDNLEGTVDEIRLMQTTLHTSDNKIVILPNSTLTTDAIINYTAQEYRRLDVDYRLYDVRQIDRARAIILEHISRTDGVVSGEDKRPVVAVSGQDTRGLILTAKLWCRVDAYWDILYAMQEQIRRAFYEEGILFPGEQIDLRQTPAPGMEVAGE